MYIYIFIHLWNIPPHVYITVGSYKRCIDTEPHVHTQKYSSVCVWERERERERAFLVLSISLSETTLTCVASYLDRSLVYHPLVYSDRRGTRAGRWVAPKLKGRSAHSWLMHGSVLSLPGVDLTTWPKRYQRGPRRQPRTEVTGRGVKEMVNVWDRWGEALGIWPTFRIHEFGIARPSYWTGSTRAVIARYHTSPSGQNRKRKGNVNEGRCVQVWVMAKIWVGLELRMGSKNAKVEVCFRMVRVGVLLVARKEKVTSCSENIFNANKENKEKRKTQTRKRKKMSEINKEANK